MKKPDNVEEYISNFQPETQRLLKQMREAIRKGAPEAEEVISYGIPTFKLHGLLVSYAAFKKHIGLYPAPRGKEQFEDELSGYKGGKGTIQFPLDKPLPLPLITEIVKFRVNENMEKAVLKNNNKHGS